MWKFRNPKDKSYKAGIGLVLDFIDEKDAEKLRVFTGVKNVPEDFCFSRVNLINLNKKRIYPYSEYYLNLDMLNKNKVTYNYDYNWFDIDLSDMSESDAKIFMSRDPKK